MRWLVEVMTLGKSDPEPLHVEAESWQKALQAVRQQRGDVGPMSGFSIELSDDGCRAVDPALRLRYDVRRAPDGLAGAYPPKPQHTTPTSEVPKVDTPASEPDGSPEAPLSAGSLPSARAPSGSQPPRPTSQPPRASKRPSLSPGAAAAMWGPGPAAANRPASTPAGAAGSQPIAPLSPGPPAVAPSAHPELGPVASQIVFKREEDATESRPLTYREYVFLVPLGTGESAAEALLRTQLDLVRASLERAPAGKLVNLGVFDVAFQGKPSVRPLSTLMWKDWTDDPVVEFPRRPGYRRTARAPLEAARPPQANAESTARVPAAATWQPTVSADAPRPLAPEAGPIVVHAVTAAVVPAVGAPLAGAGAALAGAGVPLAGAGAPLAGGGVPLAGGGVPLAGAGAPLAGGGVPLAGAGAPIPATDVTEPVAVHAAVAQQPPGAMSVSLETPLPPPASIPPPPHRKRVPGEDLIADLFESMHELHFLRDAIEGGDFCLGLLTEKIPSQLGIVHLYDINRREFLVTNTHGAEARALLLQRHPEADAVLSTAMNKGRALVLADATKGAAASLERYVALGGLRSLMVAPVILSGRFLGAIELVNPIDGQPYTQAEANAMTYIAEQFAEFVAAHGIVTDPQRIGSRVK